MFTLDDGSYVSRRGLAPKNYTGCCVDFNYGTKFWYNRGKLHRLGASAIIYALGFREYRHNNRLITAETLMILISN